MPLFISGCVVFFLVSFLSQKKVKSLVFLALGVRERDDQSATHDAWKLDIKLKMK